MSITDRQKKVLEAFRELQRRQGRPPTVRELGGRLRLSSTRTVHDHLKALQAEGLLRRQPGARGLRLAEGETGLPILGRVAAGKPLLAEENLEGNLDLGCFFGQAEGLFLLMVQGDSMVQAGILPGDYVVVRSQEEVPAGAIAVAEVEGEVTVKRAVKKGQVLWLHPANPAFEPVAIDLRKKEARILGRVVGVLRTVD